jgi:protein O-mannosyl-transferase
MMDAESKPGEAMEENPAFFGNSPSQDKSAGFLAEELKNRPKPGGENPFSFMNRPHSAKRPLWLFTLLPALAVVLFYLPVLNNNFVSLDDPEHITSNLHIRSLSPSAIHWMLTSHTEGYWIPLTWLSFALNYQMDGLNPKIFHLTNVLLHALNTALVFLLCLRLLGLAGRNPVTGESANNGIFAIPAALMTALLFGLHPIHVESVAWATERKDVLYSLFYLSGIYLYLDYASAADQKKLKLAACLGLYLLALMSKPMAITLPLVFLVFDGWPLKRLSNGFSKVLVEKIPFFLAALLIVLITFSGMSQINRINSNLSVLFRILHVFHSLAFYLWKMAVPLDLSPIYPFPHAITSVYYLKNILAVLLFAVVSVASIFLRKKAPYFAAAWLYYVITLAPVIGIVQVGSYSAADRYTYLPSLSIFLCFSAGMAFLLSNRGMILGLFCTLLTLSLGYGTVGQIGIWKSSQTIWVTIVKNYPDETRDVFLNNGITSLTLGKTDDALKQFTRAAAIHPSLAFTHYWMGIAFFYKGRAEDAVREFKYALTLEPRYMEARQRLWEVYEQQGKHHDSIEEMRTAIQCDPISAKNYSNLGISLCFLKRHKEAEEIFQKAFNLEPTNSLNLVNLATVKAWQGRSDEALDLYRKAIVENPKEPVYFLRMADIFLDKKKKTQALECLRLASELNPQDPKNLREMGEDYERAGRKDLAKACFEKAQATVAPSSAGK